MKRIIIYGSHYGTTRSYAEKFSEMTGYSAESYENIKNLEGYDQVIHFGGLYAGGVKGLKTTVKALPAGTGLVIVTVGLADVDNRENTDHIKKSVSMQVPHEVMERTRIVHLRGGIDYSKLNFTHRTMMSLVCKKAEKTPEEKKTPEIRDMLETYNKAVDFVDFGSLRKVMDAMQD